MSVTISLRLDDGTVKKLEEIAKIIDCSKSYLVREAIQQYLAEYADYRIALDRLNDVRDKIISSEEMRELLDAD
ncbi:MAG: ribbon-helix-helix protein, CopG family [Theionarchaea archaeon]|nr:MAG: hypothetical protein AYK19_01775 [Theionarchaea archaeon DG-70-1]MBU7025822.1 ribbon-helix-helix protein, CopG family [Theionarchaea archaeon]